MHILTGSRFIWTGVTALMMLTNYMDVCVDQDIAVFIGGLALIDRRIAVLNAGQDQCTSTHVPSWVRIRPCDTQR